MTDAASLHCPNCGAAVGSDAPRCPYCQARLAKISCGNCFALMLDSSDFCPKCGSPRARAAGQGTSARCPACKKELQQVTVGATAVMECAACDGVWVDGDVFERLVADREAQAAVLHRFSPNRQPVNARIRYRPCVRCGKMMNRVNFGRVSGTVVDVCRGHGTYLDSRRAASNRRIHPRGRPGEDPRTSGGRNARAGAAPSRARGTRGEGPGDQLATRQPVWRRVGWRRGD